MAPVYELLTENFKARSMGLVCDFAEKITKVYSAVFPTDKILQQIIDSGTTDSMLFVHHPSIWDIRTTPAFKQMNPALVKKLQKRRISIYISGNILIIQGYINTVSGSFHPLCSELLSSTDSRYSSTSRTNSGSIFIV